jgi:putative transposase
MNVNDSTHAAERWLNRPRLKDFDYVGAHAYHLVFNTAARKRVLVGWLAEQVVDAIKQAAAATFFELVAYTVMPNHVHLFVQGKSESANAVRLVQRCKQRPGFRYRQDTGTHLWQPSFFDRAVRRDDDAVEIAEYVAANPVRAGLMSAGDVWPYSGGTLLTETPGRSSSSAATS